MPGKPLTVVVSFLMLLAVCIWEARAAGGSASSYVTDDPIPFAYPPDAEDPGRTRPLIELGDPFLGNGNLRPGFRLPGGAVWQPRLWVYGNYRSSLHSYELDNGPTIRERANRLDLFSNLQLTGTERILLGLSPLDDAGGFWGQAWSDDDQANFGNDINENVSLLFFEGDLGELPPFLDEDDSRGLDIGFSFGRQQIIFQDGLLVNDRMDTVGLTKNNLRWAALPWMNNLRITAVYAWDEINRDDNGADDDAEFYGLFSAIDTRFSSIEIDLAHVTSDAAEDIWVWGLGSTQRLMQTHNLTLRLNGSHSEEDTPQADDGLLLFSELSWTPHRTENVFYINGFAGKDNFRSAAREDDAGGPLGRTGLLFAARGIGTYPSPISNRVDESYGAAIGYQMIFNDHSQHLIIEAGARSAEGLVDQDTGGLALQFQQAFAERYIFQVDGFATSADDQSPSYGIRSELQIKF